MTLKRVAVKNRKRIVPMVYPCVCISPEIVITADVFTHEIIEYDLQSDIVNVVGQISHSAAD